MQPHDHPDIPGGFSAHLNSAPEVALTPGTAAQQASLAAILRGPYAQADRVEERGAELIVDFWERDEHGDVETVSRVTLRADGTIRRISATVTDDVDDLEQTGGWFKSTGSRAQAIRDAVAEP